MSWFTKFLTSSIGRKLIMSLTGLFLISFLVVHLIGNLQLFYGDGGDAFNAYAYFMTHNPLIKFTSIGLYAFIVIHAIQGFVIAWSNKKAKGSKYAVSTGATASFASRNMALLGTLVLAFIFIHMGDFWFKMKFTDSIPMVNVTAYDHPVADLYARVAITFSNPLFVLSYLIGMLALGIHLWHGFASAFQTLGLNHKKYTPAIGLIGKVFSVIVPLGFALIPIYMYLNK